MIFKFALLAEHLQSFGKTAERSANPYLQDSDKLLDAMLTFITKTVNIASSNLSENFKFLNHYL